MHPNKILFGMLLVCLPFFCLCTGNVNVDDVACLGEGKGGGSPILSKLDLGCCPGLKKIAGNMGVDADGVCHPAIDGGFVCAKCGDGKCGIGENKCNCPSDCSAACAEEGEGVFDSPGMGPVKCCDVDAGIKPSTRIDTNYNICSDPDRSGSKGICSKSWAKTCGNGVCDSGEDKCNCLQDCPPPECANDGEQVYYRSIDGPVRCCNANSGIKYDHRLEDGACTAVSGQFSPVGVCMEGWQKTCGDGACGSGENRCNCPKDCSDCSKGLSREACVDLGGNYLCSDGNNCFCMCPCKIDADCGNNRCGQGGNTCNEHRFRCVGGVCEDNRTTYEDRLCSDYLPIDLRNGTVGRCLDLCGDGLCTDVEPFWCTADCSKECAKKNETVYKSAASGPNWCCNPNDPIKPKTSLVGGECVYSSDGSFGICMEEWGPWRNCGNGVCEAGENKCNCPKDCPGSETGCVGAGEKVRDNGEENGRMCCEGLTEVFDQWELDGDGRCHALDNYGYHCLKCGDGLCGLGENKCNCPNDCGTGAADECKDASDCVVAVDLGGCCACPRVLPRITLDGIRFVVYESGKDYSRMLPAECRNAVCSPCGPFGSAACQSGKCMNAPICGNIYCERGEDEKTCPTDCGTGAVCGNVFCESGENKTSCLKDCVEKRVVCGDNFCTAGENESNCPVDCGSHKPVCGNGFCEKPYGENATNCANDCEINSVCGNLACEVDENKTTCPEDCVDHT